MSRDFKGVIPRRMAAAALVPITVLALGLAAAGPSVASGASKPAGHVASSSLAGEAFVPGQLLVRFTAASTAAAVSATNRAIGATTAKSFSYLVPNLQLVNLRPGVSVAAAEAAYAQR